MARIANILWESRYQMRQIISDSISNLLGYSSSRSSVIASASLVIICLFYVYTVGTYLQIRVYSLIDRVTYYIPFNFHIINKPVDHAIIISLLFLWLALSVQSKVGRTIIGVSGTLFAIAAAIDYDIALNSVALTSLPVIVSFLLYDLYTKKILKNRPYGLERNYLILIGLILGVIGFFLTLLPIVSLNDLEEPVIRNYAYEIFLLFSSFSPVLLLLLVACFPTKLLIAFLTPKLKMTSLLQQNFSEKKLSPKSKILCLSITMLISIAVTNIPHLPTVNKDNQQVGVDTVYYIEWVNALQESDNISQFIEQAFIIQSDGDRPIALILLFIFSKATAGEQLTPSTIEYGALILAPSLTLVAFLFARELTTNEYVSVLASFLTAISFHVLIGVYAGFYANWLALIIGFLSFVYLLKYVKTSNVKYLLVYSSLLIILLCTHIYTWTIFTIVAVTFTLILAKMSYYSRKTLIWILILSSSVIAVDIIKSISTDSVGGIEKDIELAQGGVGIDQFVLRWNNLVYTTGVFVGGLFSNFILLALGIYWLFIANIKDLSTIFLIVFLSIGTMPIIFGNHVMQTRILYEIPFEIPSAIAMYHLSKGKIGKTTLFVISIWLLFTSLHAVSNFYLVSPL